MNGSNFNPILRDSINLVLHFWTQGMVGSGLCYVAMSWCVKQRGPLFTSAFTPLIELFVAIFDFSILHEQIYLGRLIPFTTFQ